MFDAPPLAGPTIVGLKISPDGARVTYLKGKAEDKDRLDLWEYDIHRRPGPRAGRLQSTGAHPGKLSDEELGRRERQRTAALSGILEYSFAPAGLRAAISARTASCTTAISPSPKQKRVVEFIDTHGFATDATISPAGGYVAYLRDQNLHVYDMRPRARKRP